MNNQPNHFGNFLPIVFLSLMILLPVAGQERFGELSGVVTDPTQSVVPEASVTITNLGTNRVWSAKTGGDGAYSPRRRTGTIQDSV